MLLPPGCHKQRSNQETTTCFSHQDTPQWSKCCCGEGHRCPMANSRCSRSRSICHWCTISEITICVVYYYCVCITIIHHYTSWAPNPLPTIRPSLPPFIVRLTTQLLWYTYVCVTPPSILIMLSSGPFYRWRLPLLLEMSCVFACYCTVFSFVKWMKMDVLKIHVVNTAKLQYALEKVQMG